MLKPFLTHRTPQEPLHPSTLSMVLKKIKHVVVLLPCACGRFIHYSHPFRFISLLSISATLLRFVHFTHLSTAQQKWLILSLLQSPAQWLSVSWHLQNPTHLCFCVNEIYKSTFPLFANCSSHSKPANTHCCSPFNRNLCFFPTHLIFGMLYFFQRSVSPIQRTVYDKHFDNWK